MVSFTDRILIVITTDENILQFFVTKLPKHASLHMLKLQRSNISDLELQYYRVCQKISPVPPAAGCC